MRSAVSVRSKAISVLRGAGRYDVLLRSFARQRNADDQRLGVGARRSEVADVHCRGAEAELAPRKPVEPEVDALDERVLRHDERRRPTRRVVLDADDQPAPLELGEEGALTDSESLVHRPPERRVGRGADDRDAGGARSMHAAAFEASIPPIAITGTSTAAQMRASSSSPSGGSASPFDGVSQTGPTPR